MAGQPLPEGSHRRRLQHVCILVLVLSLLSFGLTRGPLTAAPRPAVPVQDGSPGVTLIIASQRSDNTSWVSSAFPDWGKKIYVTDDLDAPLRVPANKGREGMVYLTFIIDYYDALPPVMVFLHAERYQWHNDDPLYDGERMLSRLQLPYVRRRGFVNLRCVWTLGCPDEIRPLREAEEEAKVRVAGAGEAAPRAGSYYKRAFESLFPELPVPEVVAASCCAQFAVTSAKVRERPREDYERFRRWLLETDLSDDLSGIILEYSWHVMFGQGSVHCPRAESCYCDVYGLCKLQCEDEGHCRSQYTLPASATFPQGWPDYGWDREWRNVTKMRFDQDQDYSPGQRPEV